MGEVDHDHDKHEGTFGPMKMFYILSISYTGIDTCQNLPRCTLRMITFYCT